ncbi:hypothetical protein L249_6187 [Ophiocordyceps polyrhachis-furcata BCC 54312]|uniref:Phosphatidate phosphatase APP1 catalytic domain-containing protein n=1 Tax=Ophiocordyceps polyrhachis-furcata BCC 54312 TaxID=1330021 RepID=A0A367LIF7_9HYPO|nr:hypothetical protein L249_6187 [Ophiocordyceps polyrhachis-furcata BCC 54312]
MLRPVVVTVTLLCAVASCSPTPTPAPSSAMATPPPTMAPTTTPRIEVRGLGSKAASYLSSLADEAGSKVSSFANSGILDFPFGFPTGSEVLKSADVSETGLAALPTEVLNLPPYGNWTDQGWNVRVHGNVYKTPNISESKIDSLANVFLIGTSVEELQPQEQAQARNLTRSIFIVQQGDRSVTMDFVNDVSVRPNASGGAVNAGDRSVTMDFVNDVSVRPNASGGAVNAGGGSQKIKLPFNTTAQGDFDVFVKLDQNTRGLMDGNKTSRIQTLNLYAEGTDTGNATAYLVPAKGVTIVSDIDDILRVTKIYQPKEGLLNTFARPFRAWENMPQIYANWSSSMDDVHFHYLTTTPEQGTRLYMDFIYKTYPLGSFDTRPLNFSDLKATLAIRKSLLDKVFQTFPERKFILVADTSNSDVMKDYPRLYHEHPDQVLCIFLRNTSATDPSDRFPYDTSGFRGIPQQNYMFFTVPDDLKGLNVLGGQCHNESVRQNVTFRTQGLPFGLSGDDEASGASMAVVRIAFAAVVSGLAGVSLAGVF